MARSFDDKYAACPFFSKYDDARIHCEGYPEEAKAAVITAFETAKARREYAEQYCNDRYHKCKLFRIIASKYD